MITLIQNRLSKLVVLLLALFVNSCITRINFDIGDLNDGILVVEGSITDQMGPYLIKLFKSSNVDDNLLSSEPFIAKEVTIYDNVGNLEILINRESGIYETNPNGIRGVVGRKYSIRIELLDGTIFESIPDELRPAGKIDSVYFDFETISKIDGPDEYGFRIFLDSENSSEENIYLRWKFTGVYEFLTYPDLHRYNTCTGGPDPWPCSGAVVLNGVLTHVSDCRCCYCWVADYEKKPHLNDDIFATKGVFKNLEVGFVPFNSITFSRHKYMVKVEQMSLTKDAFEFWKVFEDQKNGLTSLFQPAFGKAKTNIFSKNSDKQAIGMFYASSVNKKILFIKGSDAPISEPVSGVPPEESCAFWNACDKVFLNASRTPPPEWK